ncbi:MAG: ADP-ribosylglycohydrolase family protein [Actinomycetota bacterium]|nr:ADP-ribosylglycohydrolase family protein [Actinomycetota bacterium]
MKLEDLPNLSAREDRRAGAVLGLAVGDSLGATHEFLTPDEVPEGPLEIVGGGLFGWNPGDPTDDTELALAVLEGYREGPLDLRRVRDAMLRWRDTDPRDIGNQTRKALHYLGRCPEALSLPEDPEAQGNGAVMRAAPHGVMARSPEEAFENAFAEASLTHSSWEARTSAALVAALVAHLVEGATPEKALKAAYDLAEGAGGGDVRGVFEPAEEYRHERGGWTVYTTRLALRALFDADKFRSGVERLVRLAGDADTNGAVAGALLGARFGASAIPKSWLDTLLAKYALLNTL